jgi:hypothetical protein
MVWRRRDLASTFTLVQNTDFPLNNYEETMLTRTVSEVGRYFYLSFFTIE